MSLISGIKFNNLEIREVSSTSGVFSGENNLKGFVHNSQETQGFGTVDGNFNKVRKNISTSDHSKRNDSGI